MTNGAAGEGEDKTTESDDRSTCHVPVLPREIVEYLRPAPGKILVDGTLGGGGHSGLLADLVAPDGLVIGLDRDPAAVAATAPRLQGKAFRGVHANYAELPDVLATLGLGPVDGIVIDLGLSSDQLADRERGFSFDSPGELDLRFDPTEGRATWQWLERMRAEPLADLIFEFGEERHSRRIARAIVEARQTAPLRTAAQLAQIVRRAMPRNKHDRIDPATRTFQALRIASNEELRWLTVALERFPDCLKPGGRLAVISFHSLEDRIVKQAFRGDARWEILTKKPLEASFAEQAKNPRSRSAKLRVAERRGPEGAAESRGMRGARQARRDAEADDKSSDDATAESLE